MGDQLTSRVPQMINRDMPEFVIRDAVNAYNGDWVRADTIASHPDVKRLIAAFAEIQKGLQLHEKRVVSASEFVIATQILMARIGPTLEQLTGDTPANGEEG